MSFTIVLILRVPSSPVAVAHNFTQPLPSLAPENMNSSTTNTDSLSKEVHDVSKATFSATLKY